MNEDFLIRPVTLEDKNYVLGVIKGNIGEEYYSDIMQEIIDAGEAKVHGIVAVYGNIVEGYACWRKKLEVFYLDTIAVKKDNQSRGIGKKMLDHIIKEIEKDNPKSILNVVTDYNASRTINFYMKNGFNLSGIVNDEFFPGTVQVHLSRKIGEKND